MSAKTNIASGTLQRHSALLLVVAGFAVVAVIVRGAAPSHTAAFAATGETCEAIIEGWRFPTIVPSYLQWQPILAELASSSTTIARRLNITDDTLATITKTAAASVARATEFRKTLGSEAAVAGAIIDARDELIRELPPAVFDELHAIVLERTTATSFVLPLSGIRVPVDRISKCRAEADFKQHGHLVPESVLWDMYFTGLAIVAKKNRLNDGSFPDSLIANKRTFLRIQIASMIYLLNVASEETARAEFLRANGASEQEIDSSVMNFRSQLIRTLPEEDWLKIKRQAALTGGTFFFPLS